MKPTGQEPIRFILQHAEPLLGMEWVASELAHTIAAHRPVEVIAVGGPPLRAGTAQSISLGDYPVRLPHVVRVLRLIRWRRRAKPTLVVTVGVWISIPWLVLPRRKTSTIVWEHSLSADRAASSRKIRSLRALAKLVYRRADAVVAVSEPLRNDLASFVAEDALRTIPNLIPLTQKPGNVPRRRLSGPPERLVVVGSLTENKRQAVILRALRSLPENVTLDVVGDGPDRASLENLAIDLGLESRTRFHGHLSNATVLTIMMASDALVHAARSETFGMVLFEAADLGVPVVAAWNRVTAEFVPKFIPGELYDGTSRDLVVRLSRWRAPDDSSVQKSATARSKTFGRGAIVQAWLELLASWGSERAGVGR